MFDQCLSTATRFTSNEADSRMIDAARSLLLHTIAARKARVDELDAISKLLAALDRYPGLPAAGNVCATVIAPIADDAAQPVQQYWEIALDGLGFRISGGYVGKGTLRDKLPLQSWTIRPERGTEPQTAGKAGPAAGMVDFERAVAALTSGELPYAISVEDGALQLDEMSSWDLAMEVLCMFAVRPRGV